MGSGAAGSSMGFIVALTMFAATFGVVVQQTTQDVAQPSLDAEGADLAAEADLLADLIFGLSGQGWYGILGACDASGAYVGQGRFDADGIAASGRFGLAEEPCIAPVSPRQVPNTLNHSKLKALSHTSLIGVTNNDRVEHGEARASLGLLGNGVSFRVEGEPIFPSSDGDPAWAASVKPLYIGNWLPPCTPPPGVPPLPALPVFPACPAEIQSLASFESLAKLQDGVLCIFWDGLTLPTECPSPPAIPPIAVSPTSTTIRWESRFLTGLGISNFDGAVRERAYSRDALAASLVNPFLSDEAPPYSATGDILPDSEATLVQRLPELLTPGGTPSLNQYNVLIVGSGVSDRSIRNATAANVILPWVQAGGRLFVLGSEGSISWLRPTAAKALLETVGGHPSAPDPAVTVLNKPNQLEWTGYKHRDRSWGFDGPSGQNFDRMIFHAGRADLAVSKTGKFGQGQIVLTSWQPDRLTTDAAGSACPSDPSKANCEPVRLLENLLLLPYSSLFLEFGPEVPSDRSVEARARVVTVYHDTLYETIELSVILHVWHE